MQLSFNHVSKNYTLVNVLNDIDFTVNSGEFIFIVGPSGAGKSTILKLILGQSLPTSGTVTIDDVDIFFHHRKNIEKVRRKIGVIFQDYQLLPDKNIEENIALALDIVSFPKDKIQHQLDEVIKKVNLNNRRFLFPSQLSGGELQRAALARALAIEPEIILADEPTGNLDPENAWNLLKLLNDINKNKGTSIIMTSHNTDIIESMGKKTYQLNSGHLKLL